MFDPAALGTLRIGLDRIQREHAWTDQPDDTREPRQAYPRRQRGLTGLAATALRRLADALSPAPGYDAESTAV